MMCGRKTNTEGHYGIPRTGQLYMNGKGVHGDVRMTHLSSYRGNK